MPVQIDKYRILRRYTDLPSLLHILRSGELTLRSPSTWDDNNDRNFMEAYVREADLASCVAFCFTGEFDLYHLWRIYADGNSGVCIEFYRDILVKSAEDNNIKHGKVEYLEVPDLQKRKILTDRWPFIKRIAFSAEYEYRFIYGSKTEDIMTKGMPLYDNAIKRIIINPWAPPALYEVMKKTILATSCKSLNIEQSQMMNHVVWRDRANQHEEKSREQDAWVIRNPGTAY